MLHRQSPHDDPTRAFRAARYANRLGFTVEPKTRAWIREAIRAGAFDPISGDRMRREIRLLFSEENRARAVGPLSRLGVDRAVDLDFSLLDPRPARARARGAARIEAPGKTGWFLYLLVWAGEVSEKAAGRVARRLSLAREDLSRLVRWPALLERLRREPGSIGPSMVRSQRLSTEEIAAAASLLPAARGQEARSAPALSGHLALDRREGSSRRRRCSRAAGRQGARGHAQRSSGGEDLPRQRARVCRARRDERGLVTAALLLALAAVLSGPPGTPSADPPPTFCAEWIRQSSQGYERLTLFSDRTLVWKASRGGNDEIKRQKLDAAEVNFYCDYFRRREVWDLKEDLRTGLTGEFSAQSALTIARPGGSRKTIRFDDLSPLPPEASAVRSALEGLRLSMLALSRRPPGSRRSTCPPARSSRGSTAFSSASGSSSRRRGSSSSRASTSPTASFGRSRSCASSSLPRMKTP